MKESKKINPFKNALTLKCPRCAQGRIFCGLLDVSEQCESCGLKLGRHDAGDGPAYIVITLVSFIVTGLAVYVELKYEPSYYLHLFLWIPAVVISSIFLLRAAKAYLIASEYKYYILRK